MFLELTSVLIPVYLVLETELAFQGIELYMAWYTLGLGCGNLQHLLVDAQAAKEIILMTGLVTFLVHIFYSWRIYVLGKKYAPTVVVMLVSGQSPGSGAPPVSC